MRGSYNSVCFIPLFSYLVIPVLVQNWEVYLIPFSLLQTFFVDKVQENSKVSTTIFQLQLSAWSWNKVLPHWQSLLQQSEHFVLILLLETTVVNC